MREIPSDVLTLKHFYSFQSVHIESVGAYRLSFVCKRPYVSTYPLSYPTIFFVRLKRRAFARSYLQEPFCLRSSLVALWPRR